MDHVHRVQLEPFQQKQILPHVKIVLMVIQMQGLHRAHYAQQDICVPVEYELLVEQESGPVLE